MAAGYLEQKVELKIFDLDPGKLEGVPQRSSFKEVVSCPLVLLCVPISSMCDALEQMAPLLQAGQVIVDTCSVKMFPLKWMLSILPESVQVVGTHPLFGPDSASEGLAGLKIVLCPARVKDEDYQQIRCYLKSLQLVVIESSGQEHDQQIAQSQAIFHFIAQAMKRLEWGGQAISTPGPEGFYRLVQSVQRDTPQLFRDLELLNPYARQCRQNFLDQLLEVNADLTRSSVGTGGEDQ